MHPDLAIKQSRDLFAGPGDRHLQRVVDMHMSLRHRLRRMPKHRGDHQLGKTKLSGDTRKGVAKRVGGDIFDCHHCAKAAQTSLRGGV